MCFFDENDVITVNKKPIYFIYIFIYCITRAFYVKM